MAPHILNLLNILLITLLLLIKKVLVRRSVLKHIAMARLIWSVFEGPIFVSR